MSAKDIVGRYLGAFFNGTPDYDTVRTLLKDDFTFQGPMMTASGADDFIAKLKGMGTDMEMRAEIREVIEDGKRVAALYDFLGPAGKMSFAEWYWIQGDRIQAIKLHYDPRLFLQGWRILGIHYGT